MDLSHRDTVAELVAILPIISNGTELQLIGKTSQIQHSANFSLAAQSRNYFAMREFLSISLKIIFKIKNNKKTKNSKNYIKLKKNKLQ